MPTAPEKERAELEIGTIFHFDVVTYVLKEHHMKTKIIIAEDHLLLADGLQQILNSVPDFEVIAKASCKFLS